MAETIDRARAAPRARPAPTGVLLRTTAAIFAVAVVVHGADHVRRGINASPELVRGAGGVQFVAAAVAVVLVFRGHRGAPVVAAWVGLLSAIGFAASHLLPHWSAFSDPYTGAAVAPHVTALSWFTALFEIGADLAFGFAGLREARQP